MNCPQVEDQLVAYLDGEVDTNEKRLIEQHLANCSSCHTELDALSTVLTRVTARLDTKARQAVLSGEAEQRVLEQLARGRKRSPLSYLRGWWAGTLAQLSGPVHLLRQAVSIGLLVLLAVGLIFAFRSASNRGVTGDQQDEVALSSPQPAEQAASEPRGTPTAAPPRDAPAAPTSTPIAPMIWSTPIVVADGQVAEGATLPQSFRDAIREHAPAPPSEIHALVTLPDRLLVLARYEEANEAAVLAILDLRNVEGEWVKAGESSSPIAKERVHFHMAKMPATEPARTFIAVGGVVSDPSVHQIALTFAEGYQIHVPVQHGVFFTAIPQHVLGEQGRQMQGIRAEATTADGTVLYPIRRSDDDAAPPTPTTLTEEPGEPETVEAEGLAAPAGEDIIHSYSDQSPDGQWVAERWVELAPRPPTPTPHPEPTAGPPPVPDLGPRSGQLIFTVAQTEGPAGWVIREEEIENAGGKGGFFPIVSKWLPEEGRLFYTDQALPGGCPYTDIHRNLYEVDLADGSVTLAAEIGGWLNLSPTGDRVAYRPEDRALRIRDLATGEDRKISLPLDEGTIIVNFVWSPDETALLVVTATAEQPCDPEERRSVLLVELESDSVETLIEDNPERLVAHQWTEPSTATLQYDSEELEVNIERQ